jgi:glucan phosphoethanolaminetransferase (alkaline phosphatase superfamily)
MSSVNFGRIAAVGIAAIVLLADFSLFHDFFYPIHFLLKQGKRLELLLSLFVFIWSLFGVFFILFSEPSLIRKITLPIFLFFLLFNAGVFLVSNAPIDYQLAVLIVNYFKWWVGAVVENIGLAVLPLVIILIPLVFLVERLPVLLKLGISKEYILVPISTVILTTFSLQFNQGIFDRYPSFFRVPSMLAFASLSHTYNGERNKVIYSGDLVASVDKIVLIVDESIRADILGINANEKNTTPYLSSLEGGVVNYGLAASSSNCSHYSNLILRTGLRKEEIPDQAQISLKTPSIWQFTRKAGFRNIYLDAQSADEWGNYQNYMNKYEASSIDELHRVRQKVAYKSDGVAREILMDILKQPGKSFVMLNKYGMHFPYFRSHPNKYDYFTPVLEPGEPMNDRVKSLNSYMNGILWSVDDWFKGLFSENEDFEGYVIIYTSDHGQNIVDDGTLATHCRPRANRFEGIVPMMVFSNDAGILERFRSAQATGYDKTTHFQIFPTLLRLAGYDGAWIRSHYGASLGELPINSSEFFVGDLHGRGSIREWVSIFPSGND